MSETKFDPTKPAMTRDGRKARIVCTNVNGGGWSILAVIEYKDGMEGESRHRDDGTALLHCYNDLINSPHEEREIEFWVNVYPDKRVGDYLYSSKEYADIGAWKRRTECLIIKRTYRPGEGI